MKKDPFDLSGKIALVTGASSGLGRGIAVALAERGAAIAGVARRFQDETRSAVEAVGGTYLELREDLSDPEAPERAVDAAVKGLGGIDILVSCAGVIRRGPVLRTSDDDWDSVVNVDLSALFRLARSAGRRFAEKGRGKVINIASVLGYQGGINVAAYSAAKHGVIGLTRALATEWAPLGINVNAIAPGYFETDMTEALRNDSARSEALLTRIPAGRYGRPEDLGGAAVLLASSASDYMHGSIVAVDGGWLSR